MWKLFKPKINDKLIQDKAYYQDLVLTKLASKIEKASKNGLVSLIISNEEINNDIAKVLQKKGLKIQKTKDNNYQINW